MSGIRSFVAIELDDALRRALQRLQTRLDRDAGNAVRWTVVEQLHLTLKFLGDVEESHLPRVCSALDEIAAACEPFEIAIRGAGCFPPGGNARVVWAGLDEPTGRLAALHAACETRMSQLGLRQEHRGFSPHVTIGRAREGRRAAGLRAAVERQADFAGGVVCVDEIVLFQSVLSRDGPTHTAMSRHALRGAAEPPHC